MTVWLGDFSVSKNLAKVPHPYGENDAEDFVALRGRHGGGHYCFTIARKTDGLFLGGIGLHQEEGGHEMGYWLGRPFWGFGFATEAAGRVVQFAFEELGEAAIQAGWFHDNPASGRVLAKLGARHNGSKFRDCRARGAKVLCHEMLLTQADFLRKQAA
jgi:RimJ/RimL family protein N-acetyltransferase